MFTLQDAIDGGWVDKPGFTEGYRDGFTLNPYTEASEIPGQEEAYDKGFAVGVDERAGMEGLKLNNK
jgi:hypothetical protein